VRRAGHLVCSRDQRAQQGAIHDDARMLRDVQAGRHALRQLVEVSTEVGIQHAAAYLQGGHDAHDVRRLATPASRWISE
jgi:hypothetical protein